jgi:putative flippase GtrA
MLRFLRSLFAGGVATLADLATLACLVSMLHVAPRVASVPALLVGAVVQFMANRRFVFGSTDPRVVRQVALFALVEILALFSNAILYENAMRFVPAHHGLYAVVRLATSNLVYLAFSYPLWRFVFTESDRRRTHPPRSSQ